MKKTTKILSAVLGSAITIATVPCYNVLSSDKDITVEMNGNKIEFDVKPQIIDGSTMVPLRKIFEELGAYVKWDGDTQTVSARKNSKTVSLTINSDELKIDKGKTDSDGNPIIDTVKLEVPPQIVSERTLIPARAVSEAFGLNVDWDENEKKVKIKDDKKEEDESWKENTATIDLDTMSATADGIEINGKTITITKGGDFTVKGTLEGGNIVISTKEKVKLRLSGMKISNSEKPCIFVEKADKMFITLEDGTENFLISDTSEDAVLYSKENLEIKGDGILDITATAAHAIKASDNLTLEKGTLKLNAANDGIHINDTFKMTGGNIEITATGDGIDCESIINILGGKLDIKTNGVPIDNTKETAPPKTTEQNNNMPFGRFPAGMFESAEIEFEKSSKGINAQWLMSLSECEINVDSASHAIHCDDEAEINNIVLKVSSKYEKGISTHGNLTINGSDTVIDISKSTEGIESKNVMTINDGNITIVSSDDAINATGANSGAFFPGGGMMQPGNANGLNNGRQPNQMPQNNGQGNGRGQGQMPQGNGRGQVQMPQGNGRGQVQMPQGNGRGQHTVSEEFRNFTPPADGQMPQFEGMTPPAEGENPRSNRMPFNFSDGDIPEEFRNFTPPAEGQMPQFEGMTPPAEGQMPQFKGMTPPAEGENKRQNNRSFMGGGRNMKECLIINGGNINVYAGDDGIDANGNITINGGIIKAALSTGSFLGNFGVLDPDGQLTVSENATLILASGGGSERSFSVPQNSITIYCDNTHESNDTITVKDDNGKVIAEFAPDGSFKAVFIGSAELQTDKTYTVSIGDEVHAVQIKEQNNIVGTRTNGNGMGFGRNFGKQPMNEDRTEQ